MYRAERKPAEAEVVVVVVVVVVVGELKPSTLNSAESVCEIEGELTAYQCWCVCFDRVSRQLIGGA